MKKVENIDLNTLNLLPVAVVLFDEDRIYFFNDKAIELFKIPKKILKEDYEFSIFQFIDESYHKIIKERIKLIFRNKELAPKEFKAITYDKEFFHIEVKSNSVYFNDKKVVQSTFVDVSDRIVSKSELSNSKETLELISKNANDIIFFYSYHPIPKYSYISPNIKKILGYSDKEFYNNPNLCYSIVTDISAYRDFENKITKQQKNNSLKYTTTVFQYKTKQGKLIWLEDNYSPIYDETGKIKSILGISRDITKEYTYKLELEQKWNNYKNLIDTLPIGVFIHKGVCLYANKSAALILEETNPKKLIGKNLLDFVTSENHIHASRHLKNALDGKQLKKLNYTITTKKGKVIEIEIQTVPFIFNGENCLQTTLINVSAEKKLVEETLRAQLAEKTNIVLVKAIKERNYTQAKLNTIFNTSTHIIWSVDKDYKLSSFNQNYFSQISKYYNSKIEVGIDFKKLYKSILNPTDYSYWMNKYEQAFKGENVLFETVKEISGGDLIYREIYLNPTFDEKGKVTEVVALSHNITERKINELKANEQSAKLKAIFENGNQLIWTVNRKHYFTSFNKNFSDAMYDVHNIRPKENVNEVYNPYKDTPNGQEIHQWWIDKYEQVFLTKKGSEFTVEQVTKSNKKVFRQIFINPIYNSNGEVNEISCLSYDITELKYLQSESLKLEQKISSIFENTSHLVWTIDKKFNLSSFNKNFSKVFYDKFGKKPALNINLSSLVFEKNRAEYILSWYPIYKKAFGGEKQKFEKKDYDKKRNVVYREVYINPIKNEKNEIVEIACLAHDITENKNYETKILNQSAKLQAIFESGNQLMWTITKDLKLTSFNHNYASAIYDLYEFYPQENKTIRELSNNKTKDHEEFWNEKYEDAFNGHQLEFTTERTLINGNKVFRQYYLSPIKGSNGEILEVSGLGFDVTENKQNEEKIIQSLKEKEVLLKEVHHRVKNNMQVISSILNLQSSYVHDSYALNLLKECQNRIKSMAFIHESLYQTKNFEEVNFSDYVSTLAKNLIQSYSVSSKKVKLILTFDKLFLNLDTSIPCGLIINEIISNSLKYAFVDNRDGIIIVTIKNDKSNIRIEVGDNGIGMPKEIDIKQTKTLGLQLIDTLTDQISGTLKIDTTKGTKFIIEFKI